MPTTIMLAGAPELPLITEQDLTINQWLPEFAEFLAIATNTQTDRSLKDGVNTICTGFLPSWRSVPLQQTQLTTGWSQRGWMSDMFAELQKRPAQLVAEQRSLGEFPEGPFANGLFANDKDDVLTQFVEHSYSLYEQGDTGHDSAVNVGHPIQAVRNDKRRRSTITSVLSSVDTTNDDVDDTIATSIFLSATPTARTSLDFSHTPNITTTLHDPASLAKSLRVSAPQLLDLSALPSANHLMSIQPQTMTVDLIAGIISLPAPRTVTIRRTGKEVDLIEMLVGDETRAGFGITFWIPASSENLTHAVVNRRSLHEALELLRVGDVVLLRNVALSYFRKVVYGQSLKKKLGGGGWETEAILLHRPGSSKGCLAHLGNRPVTSSGYTVELLVWTKIKRVAEWTRHFVNPAGAGVGFVAGQSAVKGVKRKRGRVEEEELPPNDTP